MSAAAAKVATVDPVDAFRERAEARAMLYAAGEYTLIEAVDALQLAAEASGLVAAIGQAAVQQIMSNAFAPFGSRSNE
jgi:hypothetical protein